MKRVLLTLGLAFPLIAMAQVSHVAKEKASQLNLNGEFLENPYKGAKTSGLRAPLWSSDFSDTSKWAREKTITAAGNWVIGTAPSSFTGVFGNPAANGNMSAPYAYYNAFQYHPGNPSSGNSTNPPQDAWLRTTDTIDVTGISALRITFNQRYVPFNSDQVLVEISDVSGSTWVSKEVNATVSTNTVTTALGFADFDVSGIDSLQVRFRFLAQSGDAYAGGYGWAIDNVELTETPEFDVTLDNPTIGLYTQYPLGQEEDREVELTVEVSNDGYVIQELEFEATSAGNVISNFTDSINPFVTDTVVYADLFAIPTGLGSHTVIYSAAFTDTAATDTIASLQRTIAVTNNTYSKDIGYYYNGMDFAGNTVGGQAVTNVLSVFEISKAAVATSVGVVFGSNSEAGASFRVTLHRDGNTLEEIASSDFTELAAADINTASGATPKVVKVDFFNTPIPLTPGFYWVSVDVESGKAGVAYDPFRVALETDALVSTDNRNTLSNIIGGVSIPYIRLNLNEPGVSIKENEVSASVSVFPNPTADVANVSLKNVSGLTTINVFNINGQLVHTEKVNVNAAEYNKTIDVSNFAAGLYSISVISNTGVYTAKLTVK